MSNTDSQTDFSIVTQGVSHSTGSVPGEAELSAFVEATIAGKDTAPARQALIAVVGEAGLVDVAAIAAHFDAINRVADAAGIALDKPMEQNGGPLVEALGISRFDG